MNAHPGRAASGADAAHHEAQEALPWLANGSLGGAELERVQAHVHVCAACRADLALLHTLRAAGPGAAPDCDPEGALARLLPQLDAPAAASAGRLPVARGWRERLAANDGRWLRVAMLMQCCVIAVLAGLLVRPSASGDTHPGSYRALGASPGVSSSLLVMFKPETSERELRRIMLASGAHVAGGPTVTGAWRLDTEDAPAAVARRLLAEPAVTLAQPLGIEGRP